MNLLCSVDVAAVRAEPRAEAERVTELLRGEPVQVEETSEGWAHIRTAYDYPGWVREEDLAGAVGDPVEEARAYLGPRTSGVG
jgi:SH3-like domain-containing protein